MILRPIAALVAAVMLAGCQSVDVKPAQPTLHIPPVAHRLRPCQPDGAALVA